MDFLKHMPIFMLLLPLGGMFITASFGFAVLAVAQIAIIPPTVVFAFRLARRFNRGRGVASLASVAGYMLCCFLTNWIGLQIVMRKLIHS